MEEMPEEKLAPTSESLKELGNNAVKNKKFEEAVLHYTHAIKLDPSNYTLYSNRSFAFLKIQQYSLSIEDANETIRLNPLWPKGYFRKGEVEFATYHFVDACKSYETALKYKPDDVSIIDAIERAKRENMKDRRADDQIPWLGAGIGIVIGVIILIADYIFTNTPTHPIIMTIATIAIALAGYGVAKAFRYYVKCQRDSNIDPPPSLVDTDDSTSADGSKNETRSGPRYTKSQARQRFKKGKM